MTKGIGRAPDPLPNIVKAEGEEPLFKVGDNVKIAMRFPIGHFRVPNYIRSKRGRVEAVIEPPAINNEDEGFGRNAGERRHYYRIAIPLTELWSCCFPRAEPALGSSAAIPRQNLNARTQFIP
jgi:nitrile hydratase subunit beta